MKTYAICGASGRGYIMYAESIVQRYADVAALAGIFDINPMRATYVRDCVDATQTVPVFTDFDEMLAKAQPEVVIVTTMDSSHHEYVVRALDAGCEVICEKPMTIDAEKTKAILDAERRNNRRIIVTFNARYTPFHTKIRQLLADGVVGEIKSVDFEWLLDRVHGADYFRRWHKQLKNGGGLLITKATHHFDLINWWTGQDPLKVYANGELCFYGPNGVSHAACCRDCKQTRACPLVMEGFDDLQGPSADEFVRKMYFEPEVIDGYKRDQCVFAQSDIWDNMSLSVRYTNNMLLTYSLHAFAPYEGWKLAVNGTKGRLEAQHFHRGPEVGLPQVISLFYPNGERVSYTVPHAEGMHGGGDDRLLDELFRGVRANPLCKTATSREGAMSLLIGAAANISIQTGNPVFIKDLVDFTQYE